MRRTLRVPTPAYALTAAQLLDEVKPALELCDERVLPDARKLRIMLSRDAQARLGGPGGVGSDEPTVIYTNRRRSVRLRRLRNVL